MAELEADGEPVVLGIPDEIRREEEQGRQGPQVGPGRAQGLGVRPEDGPEKDGANKGHSILAEQSQPGGQARRHPAAPVIAQGRQPLVHRQGPGQGQGGVGGGQDAGDQARESRARHHQGQKHLPGIQAAGAVKANQHQQGQSRGQEIAQPPRQGRGRGQPRAQTQQCHPRRVVEIAPVKAEGPIEIVGLILGHREHPGSPQSPEEDEGEGRPDHPVTGGIGIRERST